MPDPDDLAPEPDNREQDDAAEQAQTVADEALRQRTGDPALGDSEKVGGGLDPVDTPDLVDHMKQMESSGRIDMSAFRGEDSHDDLEGRYGKGAAPDPEFSEDDS